MIRNLLFFISLTFAFALQTCAQSSKYLKAIAHLEDRQKKMNVTFNNIKSQKIKDCFKEVLRKYSSLHPYTITLSQKHLKASTMQAQPEIHLKHLFSGITGYKVNLGFYVRDSEQRKVSELPKEVLIGWFAHELGHIVDYEGKSLWSMAIYGLRYIFSHKFKREAEHEADRIAVSNGFIKEIIATKKYLLETDFLAESYKNKIRRYYMSIADAELCVGSDAPIENPKVKL